MFWSPMFRSLCMELRRPPDPGVRSWVRVTETDRTLLSVDVACDIASSTEVFIFTVSRCATLASFISKSRSRLSSTAPCDTNFFMMSSIVHQIFLWSSGTSTILMFIKEILSWSPTMTSALWFKCTCSLLINLDITGSEELSISGGTKVLSRLSGEPGSAPVNSSVTSVPAVGIVPT